MMNPPTTTSFFSRPRIDENGSSIPTRPSNARSNTTPTKRKKPSLNENPRRPTSRPIAGRRSLGSVSLNGVPRVTSITQDSLDPFKTPPKATQSKEAFDSRANKENIPPFPLGSMSVFSPSRPVRETTSIMSTFYTGAAAAGPSTPPRHTGARDGITNFEQPDFSVSQSQPTSEDKLEESMDQDTDVSSVATPIATPTKKTCLVATPQTSPRYTRSITPFQRDGKFILRFGMLKPCNFTTSGTGSDSSSDEDSDNDDDDIFGSPRFKIVREGVDSDSESDSSASDSDSDDSDS